MEKPSPRLSNEIKALSQIVVLKRDVWEGLSQALSPLPLKKRVSVLYSLSRLYLKHSHNGTSKPRAPIWKPDLHRAEARRGLQKHYD